jgi:hypothetical protein
MTSYRKIALKISDGILTPRHLGEKTYEVLKQELFSLRNQWNPNTWTEEETTEYNQSLIDLVAQIEKLDDHQKFILNEDVDSMLNP